MLKPMRGIHRSWGLGGLLGLSLCVCFPAARAPAADTAYVETQERRPWYTMLRPAYGDPARQLEYARSLRNRGRTWWAKRHFRALIASWPLAEQAPLAQKELALLLESQDLSKDAFEAYEKLLDQYPGEVPFREILTRQFKLAELEMNRRRFRWIFGGWRAPERAIPLLEKLVVAAPGYEQAPQAQLWVGQIHLANKNYLEAVIAFQEFMIRFPRSPLVEEAGYGRAKALFALSRDTPNDTSAINEAWTSLDSFARDFPESGFLPEIQQLRDRAAEQRENDAWTVAHFYDRHHTSPEAARLSYERFLTRFPHSPRAGDAQKYLRHWTSEPPPADKTEETPVHESDEVHV